MGKTKARNAKNRSNATGKSETVAFAREVSTISKALRGYSYNQVKVIFSKVRKKLDLKPEKTKQKMLPTLLSENEITRITEKAQEKNPTHATILKLLRHTGMRVSEVCSLKTHQIDWRSCSIHVENGKGGKDRIVLYPLSMKDEIRKHMFTGRGSQKQPHQLLFKSRKNTAFRRESVYRFIRRYAKAAKITKNVYPHLFRHHHLTNLTRAGLNEKQIMVQSGHSTKNILGIYQHLSGLDRKSYEMAIRDVAG